MRLCYSTRATEPIRRTILTGIINIDVIERKTLDDWLPKIIEKTVLSISSTDTETQKMLALLPCASG